MGRDRGVVIAGLCLTAFFGPAVRARAAGLQIQPGQALRGIYVTSFPQITAPPTPTFQAMLATPGIDGMVVDIGWRTLYAPGQRTIDWRILDSWLSLASRKGMKVTLAVRADLPPDWLFAPPPAGAGAKKLTFNFKGHCGSVSIAAPWDPAFLGAFSAMLSALSAHLKGPLYDAVTLVRITGVNADSSETHLPGAEKTPITGCPTADAATWASAPAPAQGGTGPGFSEANLVVGWNALLAAFAKAFPDKLFSVAIIDSTNPFPIVAGGPSTSKAQNAPLVAALLHAFSGSLVIQNNSLYPNEPAQAETVAFATSVQPPAMVAFQTNKTGTAQAGCSPRHYKGTPKACNDALYLNMLNTGIYPAGYPGRAQYIEVFPKDVSSFQSAIGTAHEELFAPVHAPPAVGGCPPQPPGAPNRCQ